MWSRGLRGVLRWPAARVGRLVLLGAVAGLALRGAWEGTTPLVVVGGLALYIAALDAVEGMAEEVDRPTRSRTLPMDPGELHLRHLPVAVAVMLVTGVVGAAAVVAASLQAAAVAAACVVPGALGSVAGAATSVLSGAPDDAAWSLAPPRWRVSAWWRARPVVARSAARCRCWRPARSTPAGHPRTGRAARRWRSPWRSG